MWVAFAVQKLLTFFSAKNIRILCTESAKTVNEMTLNDALNNWAQVAIALSLGVGVSEYLG